MPAECHVTDSWNIDLQNLKFQTIISQFYFLTTLWPKEFDSIAIPSKSWIWNKHFTVLFLENIVTKRLGFNCNLIKVTHCANCLHWEKEAGWQQPKSKFHKQKTVGIANIRAQDNIYMFGLPIALCDEHFKGKFDWDIWNECHVKFSACSKKWSTRNFYSLSASCFAAQSSLCDVHAATFHAKQSSTNFWIVHGFPQKRETSVHFWMINMIQIGLSEWKKNLQ